LGKSKVEGGAGPQVPQSHQEASHLNGWLFGVLEYHKDKNLSNPL
jgi:hypothetical protein